MITQIIGEKVGMTHIFNEKNGEMLPVTVINTKPNIVINKRTVEKNGYNAVQLGFRPAAPRKFNKALTGYFKLLEVSPMKILREVKVENPEEFKIGQEIKADIFKEGEYVDVTGVSKGKGFAGVMKRHNFKGVPASHGVSVMHRRGGSIGCRTHPGKVFKGKRMAGHMGDEQVTVQRLKVVKSDADKGLLLIMGAVPGASGSMVRVKRTVKNVKKKVTK